MLRLARGLDQHRLKAGVNRARDQKGALLFRRLAAKTHRQVAAAPPDQLQGIVVVAHIVIARFQPVFPQEHFQEFFVHARAERRCGAQKALFIRQRHLELAAAVQQSVAGNHQAEQQPAQKRIYGWGQSLPQN